MIAICVGLITTLFLGVSSYAAPGVNQVISFQGRLLNATGGVVADGYYNMQFKIYQDGTGTAAGNPDGTLKWTESYVNNGGTSGIEVKNGYFSVNLGSRTAFGTSVDWNQDTLWLSMNIAGSSASCTTFGTDPCVADGEMLNMKRINAVPFALNSRTVGGKSVSELIHNSTEQQTADFNISGTGIANTLQGNTSVLAPLFDRADAGTLDIGTVNASTINIGTSGSDQAINIGTGGGNNIVAIGSTTGTSGTTLQAGSGGIELEASGGSIALNTSGTSRDNLTIDASGNTDINLNTGTSLAVNNDSDVAMLTIDNDTSSVTVEDGTSFTVKDLASFEDSVAVQGNVTATTSLYAPAADTIGAGTLSIGTVNATAISIGNDNTTTTVTGDTIVRAASGDSALAFQLQRADGTAMLIANSNDETITIGDANTGNKTVISTTTGLVTYYGSARHTRTISLTAEYNGSVLDAGTGTNNNGIMTSSVDLTNRMNYFKWTTSQATNQTYDVVVQIPLPSDFDGWASSNPLSIATYTSDTSNGKITIEARDTTNTVRCGFATADITPTITNTWSTNNTGCTLNTGTYNADGLITLRIRMQSPSGGDVRIGNINLSYLSKY